MKNIQKITGYSRSTISRVLNGKAKSHKISDRTARTIFEVAERIHYRPNVIAQSLRLKRTMTIGLIVPDIQNPFFGELGFRLEKLLRVQGYSMILCNTNEIPENEEFYLKVLFDRRVDGIIAVPIQTQEWDFLKLIKEDIPLVLLDRVFSNTDLSWVTSDNRAASEKITDRIICSGCRRIAYLGGKPRTYIDTARYNGFKAALARRSLDLEESIVFRSGYSVQAGEEMMTSLIESNRSFDAVYCVNNLVFLGAIKILQQHRAEESNSIMWGTFDIGIYRDYLRLRIVSANQDQKKLASSAAELLLDKIQNHSSTSCHLTLSCAIKTYDNIH